MFTCINHLNQAQMADLNQLIQTCREADGSIPNVYKHLLTQHRALPANILYYQDGKLSGFISAYFFYEDSCEVSLLVAPSFRRQGLGNQLIQALLPTILSQKIDKLIFSSPHQVNDEWFKSRGFEYQMTEYHMERHDLKPELISTPSLSFKMATVKDINDLCLIDKACFPKEQGKMLTRFNNLLNNRNYQLLLAYQNSAPIGKAHIRWHDEGATLSDISILPHLQGQGLGSALLAYCINYCLSEGKSRLDLDVETQNTQALNLYTRFGFKVKNACDYWLVRAEQLPQDTH